LAKTQKLPIPSDHGDAETGGPERLPLAIEKRSIEIPDSIMERRVAFIGLDNPSESANASLWWGRQTKHKKTRGLQDAFPLGRKASKHSRSLRRRLWPTIAWQASFAFKSVLKGPSIGKA
jgi:hypothetical protein